MKKEADKIRSVKLQEQCEFCNDLFWNLDQHKAKCKERKEFIDELDIKGILIRPHLEKDTIWISGGLKVVLSLRKKLSTKEYLKREKKSKNVIKSDIKLIKNLMEFENMNGIRIEYDSEDDELDMSLNTPSQTKKNYEKKKLISDIKTIRPA